MKNELMLQRLKKHLPPYVKVVKSDQELLEIDTTLFEFVLKGNDELVGVCTINDNGELLHFETMDILMPGPLKREELIELSEQFIEQFFPNALKDYPLSTVIDLEEVYIIQHGRKDDKYNVFIPNIGFTTGITTSGKIVQFYYDNEEYTIHYPEKVISKKEAKEIYLKYVDFELAIALCDYETYANGDDEYHLTYKVKEGILDIPVNGEEPSQAENFQKPYESIDVHDSSDQSIYDVIGFSEDDRKLGERIAGTERIEIWSKLPKNKFRKLNYNMDEIDPHIIKLQFQNNQLTKIISGEQASLGASQISFKDARNQALQFLFKLFPDSDQRFMEKTHITLLDEEIWLEKEHWEEDFVENFLENYEESYIFYFQQQYHGVIINDHLLIIKVGKETGRIQHLQMDIVNEKKLQHIKQQLKIPKEKAKQLFIEQLEMELTFFDEFEDGEKVFHLSYTPSFPKTTGHIHLVDALSGKMFYVDIGQDTLLF